VEITSPHLSKEICWGILIMFGNVLPSKGRSGGILVGLNSQTKAGEERNGRQKVC
jgi:hypothetical protein